MAKTAQQKTPKADASPKGPVATKGEWDFGFKKIDEVPAGVGVFNNTQRLPFDWDGYSKVGLGSGFVPVAFWTEGRGYNAEDVTGPKCRDRIRRAFYAWQNQEGHADRKKLYSLSFSDTTENGKYTGTHFYFITNKPKAA